MEMNRDQRRAQKRAQRGHAKPPTVRKVWNTNIDTIQYAIEGASITAPDKLDRLMMVELAAIDAFTRGKAKLADWSALVSVNNLTQTLAGMGIGPEAMPDCMKAEAAMHEAAERFQSTGKMGLTGPGIQAVRDVLEWHQLQRSNISRSEYEKAIRLTEARIKSGHATIDLSETLGLPKKG
jgi:hypothetical protein